MKNIRLVGAIRRGMGSKVYKNPSELSPIFSAGETMIPKRTSFFSQLMPNVTRFFKKVFRPLASKVRLYLTIDVQTRLINLELDNARLVNEHSQLQQKISLLDQKIDLLLAEKNLLIPLR